MENGSAKFTDVQWLVAGTMRPFAPFDEAPRRSPRRLTIDAFPLSPKERHLGMSTSKGCKTIHLVGVFDVISLYEICESKLRQVRHKQPYSIWPVTCTVKCCIGHCNTRSQRFSKISFSLYTVAYRDDIEKISRVSIKNSTVQSPSATMTPGNGKTAQLYTVWHFTHTAFVRWDSEGIKAIRKIWWWWKWCRTMANLGVWAYFM